MKVQLSKNNWSFEALSKSVFLTQCEDKLATSDPDEPLRSPEFELSVVDPNMIKEWEKQERSSCVNLMGANKSVTFNEMVQRPHILSKDGQSSIKNSSDFYFNKRLSPKKEDNRY